MPTHRRLRYRGRRKARYRGGWVTLHRTGFAPVGRQTKFHDITASSLPFDQPCLVAPCTNAARDGRLPVTFDTRTTFRRLRARATPAAAQQFRRRYFGRQVRRADRRQPLTWASVPEDDDVQIRVLRRERGVSQAQFAAMIGAAGKDP